MGNRLYYAVEQVGVAIPGSNSFTTLHGIQSVGITTSFGIEPAFELSQLELYQSIDNIPEVEVQLEKYLDGYCPIYLACTQGSVAATLGGRSKPRATIGFSLFDDSQDAASGTPIAQATFSGMGVSSVAYSIPVEGPATETVSLLGNDRVWITSGYTFTGTSVNNDSPLAYSASGGVQRRWNLLLTPTVSSGSSDVNGQLADPDCTILPGGTNGIPGIDSTGVNDLTGPNGSYACHLQSINVSANLGRESIFELGRKAPYFRYVRFPVEVTTEVSVLSILGDQVSATQTGYISSGVNLQNKSIRVAMKEGLRLNLGTKNKLNNISYNGGSTNGDNVMVTYSYVNWNDFIVQHPQDLTASLAITTHEIGGV